MYGHEKGPVSEDAVDKVDNEPPVTCQGLDMMKVMLNNLV